MGNDACGILNVQPVLMHINVVKQPLRLAMPNPNQCVECKFAQHMGDEPATPQVEESKGTRLQFI